MRRIYDSGKIEPFNWKDLHNLKGIMRVGIDVHDGTETRVLAFYANDGCTYILNDETVKTVALSYEEPVK